MIQNIISSIQKNYYLLIVLVKRDISKKYKDSFLGLFWTFFNPLLNMAVMSVIFSTIFKRNIENFPVYMLSGRVFYDFFSRATTEALKSIPGAAPIIKKIYVPKYIITFSKVLSNFITSAVSFLALLVVMIVTKADFSVNLLIVPVLFMIFFIFATGVGLMISTVDVFFRDMEHIYGIFLTVVMYFSAIFYPAEIIPQDYQVFLWINPMFKFVEAFRSPIYYGVLPAWDVVVYCSFAAVLAFVAGIVIFKKNQDKFIYYL